jgi:hypothetical protein
MCATPLVFSFARWGVGESCHSRFVSADQNRFLPKEVVAAVRNFVRTVITGTPMGGVVAGTLFSHYSSVEASCAKCLQQTTRRYLTDIHPQGTRRHYNVAAAAAAILGYSHQQRQDFGYVHTSRDFSAPVIGCLLVQAPIFEVRIDDLPES